MNLDYLSDQQGDLLIKAGDFVVGDATDQQISQLLSANTGDFKKHPLLGCNLENFLLENGLSKTALKKQLQKQFLLDQFVATKTEIDDTGEIEIQGYYAKNNR